MHNNLIYVTQIAGLIARRIVNYVKSDQSVNQGERYGIIKFGSRVDIEFPNNFKLLVKYNINWYIQDDLNIEIFGPHVL